MAQADEQAKHRAREGDNTTAEQPPDAEELAAKKKQPLLKRAALAARKAVRLAEKLLRRVAVLAVVKLTGIGGEEAQEGVGAGGATDIATAGDLAKVAPDAFGCPLSGYDMESLEASIPPQLLALEKASAAAAAATRRQQQQQPRHSTSADASCDASGDAAIIGAAAAGDSTPVTPTLSRAAAASFGGDATLVTDDHQYGEGGADEDDDDDNRVIASRVWATCLAVATFDTFEMCWVTGACVTRIQAHQQQHSETPPPRDARGAFRQDLPSSDDPCWEIY